MTTYYNYCYANPSYGNPWETPFLPTPQPMYFDPQQYQAHYSLYQCQASGYDFPGSEHQGYDYQGTVQYGRSDNPEQNRFLEAEVQNLKTEKIDKDELLNLKKITMLELGVFKDNLSEHDRKRGLGMLAGETSEVDIEQTFEHLHNDPIFDRNGEICLDLHYKRCKEAQSLIKGYIFASYILNKDIQRSALKIFTGKGCGSAKIPVLQSKLKDMLYKYGLDFEEYKPGQFKVKL